MKKRLIVTLLYLLAHTDFIVAEGKSTSIPILVVPINTTSQAMSQNLPGRVEAYRTAEVRARVSGIIQKRVFEEGSHVKAGQVLFQIEGRRLKAELLARKAHVATAQAASLLSTQTLTRYKELLSMGAVSKQEHDSYLSQNHQSIALLDQAKANLEIAKINFEYLIVKAPISGRIGRALVSEGALTSAGITQLATIEQIDKVYVYFSRPSDDLLSIHKATQKNKLNNTKDKYIELLFSDGSQYQQKAQLDFSSMTVEQETGNIALRAIVENPNLSLLPGMFIRVKIPIANTQYTMKVPQKSVTITPKGPQVFLIKDNKLVPKIIKLGPMVGGDWYVKEGLQPNDRVVASDTSSLSIIPGASFIGMTATEMKAAAVSK